MYMTRKFAFFILIANCFSIFSAAGQEIRPFNYSAGINFEFGYNHVGGSYVSISIAGGVQKNFYSEAKIEELNRAELLLARNANASYQAAINIYYNSIGDNILDDFKGAHIDFVHSLMSSLGTFRENPGEFNNELMHKPFHSQTAAVVRDRFQNSITVGTNFILNNTNRNQRVGFMNFNLGRFLHLHYFNDGTPYTGFSSDGYDRWWTGGGSMELYFNEYFRDEPNVLQNSRVTVSYDRFTGNVQKAFLAADVFGFYYVPTKDLKQNFYNRSKFKVGIRFFDNDFEVSLVKLGKLGNEVQDYIHGITANPVHLTYSKGDWFLGVNYSPLRDLPNL